MTMLGNLALMYRARKFVGRVAAIYTADNRGATGVMVERVSLAGIEGELSDGDQTLIGWFAIEQIQVGPESDRGFARRREQLTKHRESCPSCGDGHKAPGLPLHEIEELLGRRERREPGPADA